jgi:hypothetical protein
MWDVNIIGLSKVNENCKNALEEEFRGIVV